MYKILISGMAYDGGKSGISVYMNQVIAALSAHHEITLVMGADDAAVFPVKHANLQIVPVASRWCKPWINMWWHLIFFPFLAWRGDYDLVFLPAANRRACLWYPRFTIGTVHDLSQYHVKAKYDWLRMFYIKQILPRCVKRMDKIVAVSNSTKSDLIKYWHVAEKKIAVCYNGYDRNRFHADDQVAATAPLPDGLKTGKYILYISRIEHPGKNHLNLIKAYEQLPESLRKEYELVLAGSFWPGAEPVQDYAASSPAAATIKFTGFVAFANLPALYHQAALYVFPSFFEGFGLSLAEAMACGTPIACSNNSSLGEVGGNAALQFNPESVDEIRVCLERGLTDTVLRENMINVGYERLKLFDWEQHAATIIEIYEQS